MARINDRESSEPLDSLVKELAEAKRLLAEMTRPEATRREARSRSSEESGRADARP